MNLSVIQDIFIESFLSLMYASMLSGLSILSGMPNRVESQSDLLIAVQPTRGLDVGAIEFIHSQLVKHRDDGKAVLLVSLELDEVMNISDRILVMYEGEIVADLNPKDIDVKELGLYMAGSKRGEGYEK